MDTESNPYGPVLNCCHENKNNIIIKITLLLTSPCSFLHNKDTSKKLH